HRPAQRAHDAGGHCGLKAVRISDGNDELADTKRGRVTQCRWLENRRIGADDREIGFGIVADETGGEALAVGECDLDLVRAAHDVTVGQDVAVGRENESRPTPASESRGSVMAYIDLHDERSDTIRRRHDGT